MSESTPPLRERQDALQAVLDAIGTLAPRSQRRILESAAVFLNIPLDVAMDTTDWPRRRTEPEWVPE